MKYICLPFLLIIFGIDSPGQNQPRFFKVYPLIDQDTPEWARLMYGDNPNIKQVDFEYEKYYEDQPFEKNIHTQNYKHWRRQVDVLMGSDGLIHLPDAGQQAEQLQKLELRSRLKSGQPGTWSPIGPFTTYANSDQPDLTVSWQANVYCFDQSESRPEVLFAGTEAGGLFKSTNKGMSWRLVTASVPVSTINDVKICATNPDLVWFAANNRIYKTVNGGETWSESFVIGAEPYQLLVHPVNPDIVFCAAANGLYKTSNAGTSWTRIITQTCWDVKFHPADPDIVYLARNNPTAKRCEFFKSIDGGGSFTIREAGWYVPANVASATDMGAKIGITPAAPDLVYVALIGESKTGDNGWIGLYKSSNAGESWINPNLPDGGPYTGSHVNPATLNPDGTGFHQGFYDFALAVSHTDPNKIWLGTVSFSRSTNGGASWTRIGSYNAQQDIGWIHPDIQDLHVRGNEIFVCSDGGINYSTDELRTHETRNYGLAGSDYWGFGQGWNEDVLVGGRYHNGNSGYYQNYGTGNSLRLGGAEAPTGYVNPMENRKAYFSDISSVILPESVDEPVVYFSKLGKYPLENYTESYSSEIEWDPRYAGHLYLGEGGKIWKSTNGGGYFEVLYSFGSGKVLEIEVSRSNPKVIYCVYQSKSGYWDPCVLRKTTDGGKTWAPTTLVPTNDRWRLEISLNPENENELWVISVNGANGRKVYRTIDGGATWESKNSELLNDERPLDIQFQGGTDGVVYLATATGAYYYDPATVSWTEFMNDLPVWTRVMEMKPFYAGNKIRMATGGRGIWETDLVVPSKPLAQPMTQTDTVFNGMDTVRFESYSIIRTEGARWLWEFSPEPVYVSSPTVRNPRVVFGRKGSFDVTLTVTDAQNRSDSKTVPSMVTVADPPGPEPSAGKAAECKASGDYAVTGDLGFKTKILTISAWVKPDGIQPDYSGIVMNNGTAAGFNFRGGNNSLGYHWPGGAWWWDSKLIVPAGQWSHVALVANQSTITLYVNGKSAIHSASLQEVDIATMDIGSYMGWGDRNFKGLIDEVCIWKRALTTGELREGQHLTREDQSEDPDFIADHQFNEPGATVYNRVGSGNGSLFGTTLKVLSTAPVGSGTSFTVPVNSGGVYDFSGTGLTMTFPSGATLYPGGDVVATRINNPPATRPNSNAHIENYWILNSYGSDHFSAISEIRLSPAEGEPSDSIIAVPGHARLFSRSPNSDTGSWEQLCGAGSVVAGNPGQFLYGPSCGIAGPVQLFIASDDPSVPLLKGNTSGIDDSGDSRNEVRVYPNPAPANSEIHFNYSGYDRIRIRIYDPEGRLVYDIQNPGPGKQAINIPGLNSGIYFYSIKGERFIRNGKLVVN